jgi:hypothetical protein
MVALFLMTAPTASAHGPDGLFQVQPSTVVAPLTVSFRVRLIYSNDTDPVTSGATVTVRGAGPGGTVGPVGMGYAGTDGYYTATVTFPSGGTWSMTFSSQNPAAQYVHTQNVPSPAPEPTTPPPTAPPPTEPPTSTAPPPSEPPEPTVTESTPSTEALTPTTSGVRSDEGESAAHVPTDHDDDGYDWLLVMVGAFAAVVALGTASLVAWRGSGR